MVKVKPIPRMLDMGCRNGREEIVPSNDKETAVKNGDKISRDGSGRFQKGNGCGRGRPSGSRNKASMLVEKMLADEAGTIAKTAIDLAKAGDSSMLKCCMERLLPPQRTRPVDLPLPNMTTASDLPRVTATVLNAVASGVLYPSEARELVGVISAHQRSLELAEIKRRLDALEAHSKR